MISSLQVDMIQYKCIWWLTGLIKWALCIRPNHREKMPLSRPMHGSELKRVASGRIMLTNGLVSVRTLVLSLLHLFVSSALFSTWCFLLILLLPLYTQLFFRLCCAPSPSCCSLLMRLSKNWTSHSDSDLWHGNGFCSWISILCPGDYVHGSGFGFWSALCSQSSDAPLDCLSLPVRGSFCVFLPQMVLMVWDLAAWQEPKCGLAD